MAQRSRASTMRSFITPSRSENLAFSTPKAALRKSASRPGGVKAMAAMWEGASKDPSFIATPAPATRKQVDTVSGSVISPYSENVTPPKTVPPVRLTYDRASSKGSAKTFGRVSLRLGSATKKPLRLSASDSTTLRAASRPEETSPSRALAAFRKIQLRQTPELSKKEAASPSAPLLNDSPDHLPSLGTMVPQEEEPPVDRHMNFSRPPSAVSGGPPHGHDHDSHDPEGDPFLPVPTSSPVPGGGNCLLHAQIRSLQKQLEARDEEASSLRRQLETRENMDIGTLSEQLREAKRESAMWKSRAEAAEKRLAVFEGFTMRLRDIRVPQVDAEAAADDEAAREVHEEGHESDGSTKTTRTEEIGVLTNRIRQSLKGLDGARSSSAASSTTSDGGASAWWNQPKQDGVGLGPSSGARFAHGGGRMPKDVLEIAEEVWAAAQELLGHEGATWEEREGHQA
ncbi:hypothetical protein VD0004_g793 [Verticillium dahliae]|uniref:Uncharacterized protein n=1 Tax=Verticillium dahliae TaxID=27337 RepID=A0A366NQ24_VERDA|nr:Conidial development protein fluffy [Verticillium dahliae VDG1]PNH47588.1 hypothetical protein VD0004_g793 [Verticillium dahliae]RBQ82406.1 hypothetical protein VDGD_09260 [Verticillium dahliae]RXG47154.1 hypothetical protein VDGE_09260 [Verticillium dahliae]